MNFVEFTDGYKWTDLQDFTIDTSAVATAGLGLVAKIGLGKRVATVLGIKQAGVAGNLIDGLLDFTGSVFRGSATSAGLQGALLDLFKLAEKTEGALQPLFKAGENVIRASTAFAAVAAPLLGPVTTPAGALARIARGLIAAPALLEAGVNLLGALTGFWGVAQPLLPEIPAKPGNVFLDPQFHDAAEKFAMKNTFPLDPGFRGETSRPRRRSQAKRPPRRPTRRTGREIIPGLPGLGGGGPIDFITQLPSRPVRLGSPPRPILPDIAGPRFKARFRGRIGVSDLQEIIRELKKLGPP